MDDLSIFSDCCFVNFDIDIYKNLNIDLIFETDIDYYKHYFYHGQHEKRIKSFNEFMSNYPSFDVSFYKEINSDLNHIEGIDVLTHYHNNGKNENRITDEGMFYSMYPDFNYEIYRLFNTDLQDMNKYELMFHYHNIGKNESRIINDGIFYSMYPDFNYDVYKSFNSDLQDMNKYELMFHFHNTGKNENRISINEELFFSIYPYFNFDTYKLFNVDLQNMNKYELISHYNNVGKNENRISSIHDFNKIYPSFDLSFYKKIYNKYSLKDDEIMLEYLYNKNIVEKIRSKMNIYILININIFYKIYPDFNIDLYKIYLKKNNQIEMLAYSDLDLISYFFKNSENYIENFKDFYHNLMIQDKIEKKNINENVIYSLKTFYKKYNNFYYYSYFKFINSNNISYENNLGEVETIISAYENIENLDQKFFNEFLEDKKKDIIIQPHLEFNLSDGGTTVQYYLAQLLDKFGFRVRIYNNFEYIKNKLFNNYFNNDINIKDSIVIYSEAIIGNPLNGKNVIRWVLSELGKNVPYSNYLSWDNKDIIYYFNNSDKKEIKYLSPIYLNPLIKNYNEERNGYCFTYRKFLNKTYHFKIINIHPENAFELKREHTQDDCISIFNKYQFFISYDPMTFLSIISILCGCISIIYPIKNLNKQEWLKTTSIYSYLNYKNIDNLYGVAYGLEDIEYAKNTIHLVKEQWADIIKYNIDATFIPFTKELDDFLLLKNTVKNIFNTT
jgi:hypothetical protein